MKTLEWLERGKVAADPFDEFSNYWRGFNNLYAGQGSERDLILAFLHSKLTENFAQKMLNTYEKKMSCLISTPVIDMRGNGKDTSQYIKKFDTASSAVEKLSALFMIIYQVRCNFEHGQKSPSQARDRELCAAACPFVAEVVHYVI